MHDPSTMCKMHAAAGAAFKKNIVVYGSIGLTIHNLATTPTRKILMYIAAPIFKSPSWARPSARSFSDYRWPNASGTSATRRPSKPAAEKTRRNAASTKQRTERPAHRLENTAQPAVRTPLNPP